MIVDPPHLKSIINKESVVLKTYFRSRALECLEDKISDNPTP